MCGIVGMMTTNNFVAWNIDEFKQMMVLNSLRGAHSTGIASFKDGEYSFIKSKGNPYNLYSYDESKAFFDKAEKCSIVLGHGRYATMGKVDAETQHPFEEGNIVLVHNGVLSNYQSLKEDNHKHITVDSQLACALINEHGAEEGLTKLQGAYALVWYNKEDKTLNMARNTQRPLWLCTNKADTVLMFASEKETLLWNASRNKTAINEPYELPTHEWWQFKEGDLTPEKKKFSTKYNVISYPARIHNRAYDVPPPYAVGEDITFSVVDYKEYTGAIHFIGEVGDITVRGAIPSGMTIDQLFEDGQFTSTVVSIHPVYGGGWTVWSNNLRKEDFNEVVKLKNAYTSAEHSLTKYRLAEIAKKGCNWCSCVITSKNYATMEIVDTDSGEELVCPYCVSVAGQQIGYC